MGALTSFSTFTFVCLIATILLFSAPCGGSHFRGGSISWTRADASSLTVDFTVIMHFYTGGIFPRVQDIRMYFGDGTSNSPSSNTSFLNGTWDGTGTIRTIVYQETHTYASQSFFVAYISSRARQNAIINGPSRPYRIEAGVNLPLAACLGNPFGVIPGVQYLPIATDATFQISSSTSYSQPLGYSWYPASGLTINPPTSPSGANAFVTPAVPSYNGVIVNWDTSSCAAGSLYAVSVRADINNVANCHAVWDVTISPQVQEPPQCTGGGGSYSYYSTQSGSLTFTANNPDGGPMTASLIGNAPGSAAFNPSLPTAQGSNVDSVSLNWSILAEGSYSFSVQFCSDGGLCGVCSASINVNDALPQVELQVNVTATVEAVVGVGANYTYVTTVNNTSLGVEQLQIDSVISSQDGLITQCPGGVIFNDTYTCTYTSVLISSEPNVIDVTVSTVGGGLVSTVGDQVVVTVVPATTTVYTTVIGGTVPPSTVVPGSFFSCNNNVGSTTCTTNADCGSGNTVDEPQGGLCFNGYCECGVGYEGNFPVDPTTCSSVCVPPPVPDAIAFLNEPVMSSTAIDGSLILNVTIDPYLKQRPATISMQNPVSLQICGILPQKLGLCELMQTVESQSCNTTYTWAPNFYDVVFNSGCFEEIPKAPEVGPLLTVFYRSFQTIYNVETIGPAPFGQGVGGENSEVDIRRNLRRYYTYTVATSVLVQSETFQVVANGQIQYRLVGIDVRLLQEEVVVTVQTRVVKGGRVSPISVNQAQTTGMPALTRDVVQGSCVENKVGFCDQFHEMKFAVDPCKIVNGQITLNAGLECDEVSGGDPTTCGFVNVDAVYLLPFINVDFDACPKTVTYGIDYSQSSIEVFVDSSRTSTLADAQNSTAAQSDSYYGRADIRPTAEASFSSCTLSSLNLMEVGTGASDIDLGDQLQSSTFLTLTTSATTTTSSVAMWDFQFVTDPAVFVVSKSYYFEATIDIVFENTGVVQKKKKRFAVTKDESEFTQTGGVRSGIFGFNAKEEVVIVEPVSEPGFEVWIVAVAAGIAIAIAIIVVVVVVVIVRKRNKRERANSETPLPIVGPISDFN